MMTEAGLKSLAHLSGGEITGKHELKGVNRINCDYIIVLELFIVNYEYKG